MTRPKPVPQPGSAEGRGSEAPVSGSDEKIAWGPKVAEDTSETEKKGDKSEAVRAFIREHGNIPAPQIKKALERQGVTISLPQIYNIKKQFPDPKPPAKEVSLPDSVPLAELTRVLEFSKQFPGGIARLKQVVDVIWALKQS
jgi:hypothetical protein